MQLDTARAGYLVPDSTTAVVGRTRSDGLRVRGAADHRWVSAHLYYQGSLDLMLRELVAPLIANLRGHELLVRFFYLRYWQGGPHLRLRVLPADGALAVVRRTVEQFTGQFFATYPSHSGLTPANYAALAKALSRMEPDTEVTALESNNSVRMADYHPEYGKYGAGLAMDAVERHFETSSELVLDLIRQRVPAGRRRALALAALVAAAAVGRADLDETVHRLTRARSAVGAIIGVSEPDEARLSQTYAERRDQLATVAARMCRQPWAATGDAFMDGWRQSIEELWNRLTELDRDAECAAARADADRPTPQFALDNCAHLLCNRLGLEMRDEWLLRGFAERAAAGLRNEGFATC